MNHPASFLDSKAAIDRMGDIDIYLEIAHFFASNLDDALAEIHTALDSGNMPEATRLTHSLKSNCATVGADALRETCATLEALCRKGEERKAGELFAKMRPELMRLQQTLLNLKR